MSVETEGTGGVANIEMMNRIGYEYAVPGNNEGLTFTKDMLRALYQEHAGFSVIGSNLFEAETGNVPGWMKPYDMVDKGGLCIGLIGVTAPFADFYKLLGWEVRDPLEIVERSASLLRPQADLLVVISHLGIEMDKRMAEQIGDIDLILGAHTHHLFEEPVRWGKGAYLCAAGKFGEYVGVVELELHPPGHHGRIKRVSGRCIASALQPPDPEIAGLAAAYRAAGAKQLRRVAAVVDEPLPSQHEAESPLGNMLAIGLRKWTGAEIGLVNAGQLLGGLESGPVTEGMIHQLCPSPINPCRMTLAGDRILRSLEEALLSDFINKPIRGFGFRGNVLGTLCLDGLEVKYDPLAPDYRKIVSVTVNGVPLRPDREYSVGTIDMFTFGAGYASLREGRDIRYYLPEFIRDVLVRMLHDPDALTSCRHRRWTSVSDRT
jgi:2',3'-cyclic-nucleotide 2'-phosphodiesterase (5'-nucleotidase family)